MRIAFFFFGDKMKNKNKNTTLSEQFQNPIEKEEIERQNKNSYSLLFSCK